MSQEYLQDLYRVGATKPMGYLPLSTIKLCQTTVEDIVEWADKEGLKHKIFTDKQCSVASGALYVWSSSHVQQLLDDNLDILKKSKWPIHDDAFVQAVASKLAEAGPLYELIGVMFADPRMGLTKWVQRGATKGRRHV